MANLKALLGLRLLSLLLGLGFTIATVVLAAKSLKTLHHDRDLAAKLIKGAEIEADDVVAVLGTACGAAGLGIAACVISEIVLIIEKRKGMPRAFRYINEFLVGFAAILLLAVAIAASVIVMTKKASISAPGVTQSTLDSLLKMTGKSLFYKDTWAKYAMITAWFAWFFLAVSFVLIVLAGLTYRKAENRSRDASVAPVTEKHDMAEHRTAA